MRELKRYNEAIQCFDKAIEIDPNYSDAYYCKAITFKDMKKYGEAMKCYNKAIELDPKNLS